VASQRPLLVVECLRTEFASPHGVLVAVHDVSFSIGVGEIVGMVGESGSGKSMTARSILRILPPAGRTTGGRVVLDGEDLLALDDAAMTLVRGRHVALISQEPGAALNPVVSIGEQIVDVLRAHHGVTGGAARERAITLLREVGIPEAPARMATFPHQLSGGTQQRVAIAIALACEPRLLIADEPTTALDVTIQAQILEVLRGLARDKGIGLLFITHNIAAVAQIADRIVVMYAGRVVEDGTVAQVVDAPHHPYTQALLRAMPTMAARREERLLEISGQVPDLAALPTGCAFHPRCPAVMPHCRERVPSLLAIADGRRVACWLHAADGGGAAA
jgi:oligopeptide/dipeptide ABC transporter ATP-binding protein